MVERQVHGDAGQQVARSVDLAADRFDRADGSAGCRADTEPDALRERRAGRDAAARRAAYPGAVRHRACEPAGVDVQAGEAEPGSAGRSAPAAVLIATCVSTLVVNANTSAVSILLPAISDDTGASLDVLQWAVTGYSLVGAAVIVTSEALGDVFGRRLVLLGGLAPFIASCVLIVLSGSGGGVIAGRAIQGRRGRRSWPAG